MRLATALVTTLALAAPAAADGPFVQFTSDIDAPAGLPAACPSQDSESWPVLAVDLSEPERLRGVGQNGGVRASVGLASDDGGRTWQRTPLQATACTGVAGRLVSVNPQVAAGPGGATWYGQSWVNTSPFGFSVDVLRAPQPGSWTPGGSPAADEPAQNLAIVPDAKDPLRATALWTRLDQTPNPLTYLPLASRVLAATTTDGGATWSAPVLAVDPGPDRYAINVRAVRAADGAVVAIVDRLPKAALVTGVVGGVPAADGADIVAVRAADGRAWSTPVAVGPIEVTSVTDPDHDGVTEAATAAVSVKPDIAVGPDGRLAVAAPLKAGGGRSSIALATSSDGGRTWTSTRRTVDVPGQLIQPAVAVDRKGRIGLQWYDFRHDRAGDATWDLQPRMAVQRRDGGWDEVALSEPFDLHATNRCKGAGPVDDPVTTSCALAEVDAMAIGVYPDLVGLQNGFGAGYTVGPPLARDGFTDARFTRVVVPGP
jgi:hypothetical protein